MTVSANFFELLPASTPQSAARCVNRTLVPVRPVLS